MHYMYPNAQHAGKISEGDILKYFSSYFSWEIGFDISCKLSPNLHEMLFYFLGKIKNMIKLSDDLLNLLIE